MAKIREYDVDEHTTAGKVSAWVRNRDDDPTITRFGPIPTLEEVRAALGDHIEGLDLSQCFNPNSYAKALPKAPPADTILDCVSMYAATAILIAPPIPKTTEIRSLFSWCDDLLIPAVIPKEATNLNSIYYNCPSLLWPVSIHANATDVGYQFAGCTNITGEMVIRLNSYPSGSAGRYLLRNTTKEIVIYGDQAVCEAAAATANNGNAHWSAWYDPVPAVTDRGQGSYTTADDMTRIVRNGALAVSSYAPGRMVYHQGDIVRADEWDALVEAAQTIDPTVTKSTHYANLNKIEKAFDDAL